MNAGIILKMQAMLLNGEMLVAPPTIFPAGQRCVALSKA
jgi:hypothetical protein